MIDLRRGRLGVGDQRGGALLGLNEVIGAPLLGVGKNLRASFLRFGGDASRLFVRRTQNCRTLGTERTRERRFVQYRVGRAAFGVAELLARLTKALLEMGDLSRDCFEMLLDFLGVNAAFTQHRKTGAHNL